MSLDGCLAKQEVPWIGKTRDYCATFKDDVLFCSVMFQMLSRCVTVHPDVIVMFQCFYMLCLLMYLCCRCIYI